MLPNLLFQSSHSLWAAHKSPLPLLAAELDLPYFDETIPSDETHPAGLRILPRLLHGLPRK